MTGLIKNEQGRWGQEPSESAIVYIDIQFRIFLAKLVEEEHHYQHEVHYHQESV